MQAKTVSPAWRQAGDNNNINDNETPKLDTAWYLNADSSTWAMVLEAIDPSVARIPMPAFLSPSNPLFLVILSAEKGCKIVE